ncbi:tol-pal system YbgF family protein [Thermodesulfobacteriota bacterium]
MSKNDDKTEHKSSTKKSSKRKSSSSGGLTGVIAAEHRKANKVKISRKEMKTDELQESSAKLVEYLTKHGNQVLMIAGSIIIVVLFAVVLNFYTQSKRERASEDFTSGRNLYDLAFSETPPSEATLKAAISVFDDIIESSDGGKESALAYFYEGNIYFNLKEYDKSLENYSKFLESDIKNATYAVIARTNIAYCYKNKKEYEKAIEIFSDVSNSSEGYIKESSLMDLALTYEKLDKIDDAVKIYQEFIDNYPTSSLIEKVQERLNSIQAR